MRKLALWGIPAILIAAMIWLASLPAQWIVSRVQQQLPNLSIGHVDGYLWRGSVDDVEWVQRGYPLSLGKIQWRLDWMSFVVFKPCLIFSVDAEQRKGQGHLCIHPVSQKLIAHQLHGELPTTDIAEIFGIAVEGVVQIKLDGFTVADRQLEWIRGDLIWQSAQFHNGEKWLDIGNLLIALDSDPVSKNISAHWLDMTDQQGFSPLDVDVDMQFNRGRLLLMQGSLRPLHTTDPSLQDTLALISQYQHGKTYFIERRFQPSPNR